MDKKVVTLLKDRSPGNTMAKVWRQIHENHCQTYLEKKDLYTTLLVMLQKPGNIAASLKSTFKPPPKRKEMPSARLLRHAYLLHEEDHLDDYRMQIMSTFGSVLKFDSTKKVNFIYIYKVNIVLIYF